MFLVSHVPPNNLKLNYSIFCKKEIRKKCLNCNAHVIVQKEKHGGVCCFGLVPVDLFHFFLERVF